MVICLYCIQNKFIFQIKTKQGGIRVQYIGDVIFSFNFGLNEI